MIGDVDRHAVIGHHRRHAGVDRGHERFEVVLEAPAWIDLPLPERVVRIEPEFLRTAAGKVFDRQRHGGRRAHRSALEPLDQRPHDVCIEVGVFSKRLLNAVPTGLGRKVRHVAVHAAQSNGPPFAAHHLGECSDWRHVPDAERSRRDAGLLRKLGERAGAGRNTEAGIGLVVVAGVVLEEDGDAKALRLRQLLHRIREIRHLPRRDDEAVAGRRHAAVARIRRRLDDVTQDETNHLLRLNQARRGGRQRATATRRHRVDEHEPGLLFERHARDQIVDAHARPGVASLRNGRPSHCRLRP